MKKCPKCNEQLFIDALFCPNCMYEYPRRSIEIKDKRVVPVKYYILGAFSIVLIILIVFSIGKWESLKDTNEQIVIHREDIFETGEDIPYADAVTFDMRNGLEDGSIVEKVLKETSIVEVERDEKDAIISIYINYQEADNSEKEAYGIYGINGISTRNDVLDVLGYPVQNYGDEEYYYRFEGLIGAPSLIIAFDETGVVSEMQYYKI